MIDSISHKYNTKFPDKIYLKEAITLLSIMDRYQMKHETYQRSINGNLQFKKKYNDTQEHSNSIIVNRRKNKTTLDHTFQIKCKHIQDDRYHAFHEDMLLEYILSSYLCMKLRTYPYTKYETLKLYNSKNAINKIGCYLIDDLNNQRAINRIVLYQKWKCIGLTYIENQYRCSISHFPLEQLKNRGKSIEHTFSPDEENILLLAYDKNLVRIIYFLCQNIYIYFNIVKYYLIFSEKIDNYTRNIFTNKLKLWLNLDIFRASYKYNDIEKYIGKPEEYREKTVIDDNYDAASATIKMNQFNDSLKCLRKTFLDNWKIADDREKIKMSTITSRYPLSYVFKRITESYRFLCLLQLNKKQVLTSSFFRSSNLRYYISEILCDIIAQFKMLHVTESWILSTIAIYQEGIARLSNIFRHAKYYSFRIPQNSTMGFSKIRHEPLKQQYYKILISTEETLDLVNVNLDNTKILVSNVNIKNKRSGIEYLLSRLQELIQASTIESILFDATKMDTIPHESDNIFRQHQKIIKLAHFQILDNESMDSLRSDQPYLEKHRSLIVLDNTNDFAYYQNLCLQKKYDVRTLEYLYSLSKSLKYTLAQDHIRLVMSVAKNSKYKYMEMSDLLQEGMLGLTKAVERFQLDRGYQFTTYATWWVHQALNRVTLNTNQMIPLPTHVQKKVHLILNTSIQLAKKLGREPYLIEIANELRIHVRKIYQYLEASTLSRRIVSLDQKFRTGDNRTYMHLIQSQQQRIPNNPGILFNSIFRSMSKKESTIFKMRLGIYPFKRHTVDQLTRIFSVSKEKIKLIEKICFEKAKSHLLQNPDSVGIISSFLQSVP